MAGENATANKNKSASELNVSVIYIICQLCNFKSTLYIKISIGDTLKLKWISFHFIQ